MRGVRVDASWGSLTNREPLCHQKATASVHKCSSVGDLWGFSLEKQVAQFPINLKKKSGKISCSDVENTFFYNLLHLRLASLCELPTTNMEFPPSSRQKLGGCNSIIFVLPLLLLHKYRLTRRERWVSGDHLRWQCSKMWIFSDCLGWDSWEQVPIAKICLISSPPDRKHTAQSYNGSDIWM